MTTSIIVPVFNEAAIVGSFLEHLRARCPGAEIIVVDGQSSDGTANICRALADQTIETQRGRAGQMNEGAQIAHGDVLWFVHADSTVPENALAEIEKALRNLKVVGGCFRIRYPRHYLIYRVSDSLGNLGVQVFGIAFGDHGIFCRRACFESLGGYPAVPLMEDAELYRALRRLGRMQQLGSVMVANPRRYEQLGPWRTTFYYLFILVAYLCGVSNSTLVRIYDHLLTSGTTARSSLPFAELNRPG